MDNKIYPFKFLDSYTAEDRDIFFGRDEEVQQLYQMIYQSDILLLYGASGTGKTSLIQCGLASQFQKHDWLEIFVRRNKNLNESLSKALISVGGKSNQVTDESADLDWLNDLMVEEEVTVSTKTLSETQLFLKNIYFKHFRPIYLIFDQFEELFILGNQQEQNEFIATIQEILKVDQPVKLIFSIREEYLGSLYEFEKIVPELLRKKLRIDPMNLEKVKGVVLGATQSKKSIVHINEAEGEAIAEQIFEKIRGKEKSLTIQLPYLQVFLDKFYRHISNDKSKTPTTEATYTLAALSEIGDIDDILRDFLDEQIVEIAGKQECERKVIWKILSPFVTIDGTKEPIGIDTLSQHFPDISKTLIEQVVIALMNNRILRYMEEEELYEIAHDSLALRIAEKRSDDEIALLEVRNLIKSQSLLKDEARELFSEKQLGFINPFLERLKLSSEEGELIEESRVKVALEQKEVRRKKLVTQISIAVFILTLLGFLLFFWQQKNRLGISLTEAKASKEEATKALTEARASEAKARASEAKARASEAKATVLEAKARTSEASAKTALKEAEASEASAKTALKEAEEAEEKAKKANKKNEKIVGAMDFYGGKYALAFKKGKYGFIDKEGNKHPKIDFEYYKGEPFDQNTGFAEMEGINESGTEYVKYLIDTSGNRYQLINISEELKDKSADALPMEGELALDFSGVVKKDILSVLENNLNKKNLRDRIAVIFFNETGLDMLPDVISEYQNLKVLDLSRTEIVTLPPLFFELKYLEKLDLSNTGITNLPKSIGNLTNLQELNLESTGITNLPESIGKLTSLQELNLSNTKITRLPESIGNLTFLQELNLSNTKITRLPESIGNLTDLQELNLSHTGITSLAESIGKLANLQELIFFGTKITRLPESIGNLTNLQELNLSHTGITSLAESIEELTNLQRLDLSNTGITRLPESIGKLTNLQRLSLYGTEIIRLPESIGKLANLQRLDLSNTGITRLPESIGKLTNLQRLSLYRTEIIRLPESIGKLTNLQRLSLSNTGITRLPESIGNLTNLQELSLSKSLEKLPKSIENLKKLTVLFIDNNTNLKDFSGIGKLKNLKIIYYKLSKNKNLASNKAELKALQKELPNCSFYITNEQGDKVEL